MQPRPALVVALSLLLPALAGCAAASGSSPSGGPTPVVYMASENAAMAALPFSPAVRVGQMLYLSGQIGTDSSGRLVPGGIEAETRQTMQNIGAVLARAGSSFDRVVKCTVMLADMREWDAMNAV